LKELLADWKLLLMIGGGSLAALALIAYAFARPAGIRRPRNGSADDLNLIGRIAGAKWWNSRSIPRLPLKKAQRSVWRAFARWRTAGRAAWSPTVTRFRVSLSHRAGHYGSESQVKVERLVTGYPTSVKYDPSNPSDSIVVADDGRLCASNLARAALLRLFIIRILARWTCS